MSQQAHRSGTRIGAIAVAELSRAAQLEPASKSR
jgi:hypothetical protein